LLTGMGAGRFAGEARAAGWLKFFPVWFPAGLFFSSRFGFYRYLGALPRRGRSRRRSIRRNGPIKSTACV